MAHFRWSRLRSVLWLLMLVPLVVGAVGNLELTGAIPREQSIRWGIILAAIGLTVLFGCIKLLETHEDPGIDSLLSLFTLLIGGSYLILFPWSSRGSLEIWNTLFFSSGIILVGWISFSFFGEFFPRSAQ